MDRFLESLSLSSIEGEFIQVEESCYKMYRLTQQREDTEVLNEMYCGICTQPGSSSVLSAIANAWPHILNLERQEADQCIRLRYDRYGIMLTNYFAWRWLDCFVVQKVKTIVENMSRSSHSSSDSSPDRSPDSSPDSFPDSSPDRSPDSSPDSSPDRWLVKLVEKIQNIRFLRVRRHNFNPADFDINLSGQVFEYRSNLRWDSDPESDHREIIATVVKVLQHWLGFPIDGAYRQRAWFIHALVEEVGQSVLFLNQTWNAYNSIKRSTFSIPERIDSIMPLREAARHHPLHNPQSEERKVLNKITKSILEVFNLNLPINGPCLAPNPLIPAFESALDRRLMVFISFVRDGVRAALQPNVTQNDSAAYTAMINNRDQFLPFREHATSRIRFKSPDGPFHEGVVRTRSGLFSALIWRGITFATRFSVERKMVFHSLEEFQDELFDVSQSNPDPSYVCNKCAYGVYNASRSPTLAEDYWEATGKHDWSSYVKGHTVPFTNCYQEFFRPGKSPVQFPQIGLLAAYLLTVDYAYAGIVDFPTLDEVSRMVRFINRGAVSGLEHLGLIKRRVKKTRGQGYSTPNQAECCEGIGKIHELLKSVISIEEQQQLPVDGILVEHMLCKFSRCVGKGMVKF